MTSPLPGVDRAAFAAALTDRLRRSGLDVGLPNTAVLVEALATREVWDRSGLFWTTRAILATRHADLAVFDMVFNAVFSDLGLELDHRDRRRPGAVPPQAAHRDEAYAPLPGRDGLDEEGAGLPWVTLPPAREVVTEDGHGHAEIHQRLPSALAAVADVPFAELDPERARMLHRWLSTAFATWPQRRTRRLTPRQRGSHIDLRATLAVARRTGWEPARLVRLAPGHRPRRLVLIADVSQSMQAQVSACLHLMRGAVLNRDAEAFAFATGLTRITPALAHSDVGHALEQASRAVVDRFGGTRIASNLHALMRSRHGAVVRGAVVLIVSDGWDSDPPQRMAEVMARLHRRAHTVVWLNPRMAAGGYLPLVGGMAAAWPHCDRVLPGHDLRALMDAVEALSPRA
jgi:uncharacterized protein with von Willebrand factor type A (vWA) domain